MNSRPLPLTRTRLTMIIDHVIETHTRNGEAEKGYTEQTLLRIQDGISQFLDQSRAALITQAQEEKAK